MGKTFLGVTRPGGPGGKILGVAPKHVDGISSGPTDVQKEATAEAPSLTVWPQ